MDMGLTEGMQKEIELAYIRQKDADGIPDIENPLAKYQDKMQKTQESAWTKFKKKLQSPDDGFEGFGMTLMWYNVYVAFPVVLITGGMGAVHLETNGGWDKDDTKQ